MSSQGPNQETRCIKVAVNPDLKDTVTGFFLDWEGGRTYVSFSKLKIAYPNSIGLKTLYEENGEKIWTLSVDFDFKLNSHLEFR